MSFFLKFIEVEKRRDIEERNRLSKNGCKWVNFFDVSNLRRDIEKQESRNSVGCENKLTVVHTLKGIY